MTRPCSPAPPIRPGQLWRHREKRRDALHRVLWVSPCAGYLRAIRCGGREGRNLTAARLRRSYVLARDVAA